MIYTKTQMVYQHEYEWTFDDQSQDQTKNALGPLNRAQGMVVLSVVNQILKETNRENLLTGQLLERLLIDHLPNPHWSRNQVLAWLRNKLQSN